MTSGGFGEDFVGGLGPGEGLTSLVPAVDVGLDSSDEVFDRGEGAAADGLTGEIRLKVPHRPCRSRGQVQDVYTRVVMFLSPPAVKHVGGWSVHLWLVGERAAGRVGPAAHRCL